MRTDGIERDVDKSNYLKLFKRQYHKMVKHNQTIRRQITDELFECV